MDAQRAADLPRNTHFIWLTLEEPDVIEIKRLALDRDVPGAAAFFQQVVVPQVRRIASQRGIPMDVLEEGEDSGSLSGQRSDELA